MKRYICLLPALVLWSLFSSISLSAQSPEAIVYQAQARDSKGSLIKEKSIQVRFGIRDALTGGSEPWWETYPVTTDKFGLFTVTLGDQTPGSTVFTDAGIDWATNSYYLNVQVTDDKGNTTDMGTTQFLSVPYALHAGTASSAIIDNVADADADPANELQNLTLVQDNLKLSLTDDEVSLEDYVTPWEVWSDDFLRFTGAVDIGDDYTSGPALRVDGNITVGKRGENPGTYGISGPDPESGLSLRGGKFGAAIYLYGRDHIARPGEIRLKAGSNDNRVVVTPNGNVGIGKVEPIFNLDIIGDINLTGDIYKNGLKVESASTSYVDNQISSLQTQITELQEHIAALTGGLNLCNGEYVDCQTDENNCGTCGVTCDDGETCENGVCIPITLPLGQSCDANSNCTSGICNNGVCSECANGDCPQGYECQFDVSLNYYICAEIGCPTGLEDCYGECVDLSNDANNCGACGANCQEGFVCNAGMCVEVPDYDNDNWTSAAGDCDDTDPMVFPGALEINDGKDNDCNGDIDEGIGPDLPSSFDWRNLNGQNWMTPIKNQGTCGSCFVFSPVAALEAKIKLHFGDPLLNIDLSEQEIVSCDPTAGCDGGYPINTLNYIKDNGIVEEALFPYTSGTTMEVPACIQFTDQVKYRIDGFETLSLDNPDEIKRALIEKGPIIYLTSAWLDLSSYEGGIYSPSVSTSTYLMTNTIVGYNDAESYWIIRSNWGSSWGEDGYYRISYSGLPIVTPYKNMTYGINDVLVN